ncbi:MAG: hypothetical protein JST92_21520, partial [Deltaproteobacteria bacterium]|nr:hypothetical protein [Deltaproteobacteria bacterium]
AGLTEIVSAQVSQKEKGYAIVLRLFDARTGDEKNTHKAQVEGGPLDLAGALEHGVCSLLGAAPCVGQVSVRTDPTGCKVGAFAPKLFVDGKEDQTLPLAKALSLPVGRHSIRAGSGEERRVRVSYGRETKLFCEVRAGTPELSDDVIDAAPLVLADKPAAVRAPQGAPSGALDAKGAPKLSPQAAGGRLLVAGGLALLAVAAGTGLYANLRSNTLDERYHAGALTDADKPAYSSVHAAGAVSLTAAILGGLGLVTGTTMALLAPPADAAPVKGGK